MNDMKQHEKEATDKLISTEKDQEKKIADEIKAKSEASKAELEKVKEDMKSQLMADMKAQTAKEMKIKQ